MIGQQAQPQMPGLDVRFQKLEVNFRWAAGIAILAVVALGGVLLWNAYSAATLPKGEQVVGQVTAAWNTHDAAAFEKIYAPDAVVITSGGTKYEGIDAIAGVSQVVSLSGFKVEAIGPIVQSGNTVAVPTKLSFADGGVTYVTTIYELNGAGQIVHQQDYGQPLK